MAPDYTTKLAVWTLDFKEGILQGPVERYKSKLETLLSIRWKVASCPPGFRQVGNGLAYAQGMEDQDPDSPSVDEQPEFLGESRYQWDEGFRPIDLTLTLMLVLPEGYTAQGMKPSPTKVKEFGDRLALCWILPRANPLEATKTVEWDLLPIQDSLTAEAQRINRSKAQGYVPADAMVVVEDLSYNPSAVRDLLMAAFTAPDLLGLFQYSSNPQLRSLRDLVAHTVSLRELVDTTLEYCEKRLLLSDLLREVERANPNQFKRFAPRLQSR